MTSDPGGVILLHGLGRTAGSMRLLEKALRAAGFSTLRLNYPARRKSLHEIVDFLQPHVDAFNAGLDGELHFVTHSLGGLVVRAYLARLRPDNLGRVVMLAPPNSGSEMADLLITIGLHKVVLGPTATHLTTLRTDADSESLGVVDYPLGIIAGNRALDPIFPRLIVASPNDGKVSVETTKLAGMTGHLVLPVTHTLMTYDRRVIEQTVAFVSDGAFSITLVN